MREDPPLAADDAVNSSHHGPCNKWSNDAVAAINFIRNLPGRFEETLRRQAEVDRLRRRLTDEDKALWFEPMLISEVADAAFAIIEWNEDFTAVPDDLDQNPDTPTFRKWLPIRKWDDEILQKRPDIVLREECRKYVEHLEISAGAERVCHARNVLNFHSWANERYFRFSYDDEIGVQCFGDWLKDVDSFLDVDKEGYDRWYQILDRYRDYLMVFDKEILTEFDEDRSRCANIMYKNLRGPDLTGPPPEPRRAWGPFKTW